MLSSVMEMTAIKKVVDIPTRNIDIPTQMSVRASTAAHLPEYLSDTKPAGRFISPPKTLRVVVSKPTLVLVRPREALSSGRMSMEPALKTCLTAWPATTAMSTSIRLSTGTARGRGAAVVWAIVHLESSLEPGLAAGRRHRNTFGRASRRTCKYTCMAAAASIEAGGGARGRLRLYRATRGGRCAAVRRAR